MKRKEALEIFASHSVLTNRAVGLGANLESIKKQMPQHFATVYVPKPEAMPHIIAAVVEQALSDASKLYQAFAEELGEDVAISLMNEFKNIDTHLIEYQDGGVRIKNDRSILEKDNTLYQFMCLMGHIIILNTINTQLGNVEFEDSIKTKAAIWKAIFEEDVESLINLTSDISSEVRIKMLLLPVVITQLPKELREKAKTEGLRRINAGEEITPDFLDNLL